MGIKFLLFVGLGGACGSVLRAILTHLFASQTQLATILANVSGAFLIGFLSKWGANMGTGEFYRAFWIVGICGGFTTFSTFGIDLYGLLQKGSWFMGSVYLLANFLGTLLFIWLGYKCAQLAFQ